MKPQVSYPGLYVQEVNTAPTGIAAIPTSITAFVGRTLYGPEDEPTLVTTFGEFQTLFGGLWEQSPLTYAVADFFNNGGTQALIVRIHSMGDATDKKPSWVAADTSDPRKGNGIASIAVSAAPVPLAPAPATPPTGQPPEAPPAPATTGKVLTLQANNPGTWGNYVSVRFDSQGITDASAKSLGFSGAGDLFNLSVTYNPPSGTVRTERFTNVSVRPDAGNRRLDRVLQFGSSLLQYNWPTSNPPVLADVAKMVQSFNALAKDADWLLKSVPTGTGGSDGVFLTMAVYYTGGQANQTGLYALEQADIFNLLCIPRDQWGQDNEVDYATILAYCVKKRAFWVMDPPSPGGSDWDKAIQQGGNVDSLISETVGALTYDCRNAAVYYPDIQVTDPNTGQLLCNPTNGQVQNAGPCGAVAGIYARTDTTRGVWKAPAGRADGALAGVQAPSFKLNNDQNGVANLVGINCLRTFPLVGTVVWGARTLYGAEALEDAYKYVPVRRLTMYIEESLYRGLQWAVFEPNSEPLWASIRLMVTSFLTGLMKQGAFQGSTQKDAFFVQCDATTTTQNDIDNGICNVIVGIAPVKPAEFIILYIQQMTAGAS